MKWTVKDIDLFLQSKEYVDTVIVPLFPVSWNHLKQQVSMGDFITMLSTEIERQFKGRIFLNPPYTYLSDEPSDDCKRRLKRWYEELRSHDMKHVIFLTCDSSWKQVEEDIGGSLLWIPSIPLEHMEEKYKREIIHDQVKQVMDVIIEKWKVQA
jgi:hypothetical protein